MITFKELLKRAKNEKIAIHTPTEEQAITLLKALDEKEYTWFCGEKLTNMARYEGFREKTCYVFSRDCCGSKLYKEIRYGSLKVHQECGYTIIEFSDINFTDKPSKTTPKSDIKTIYQSEDKLTTCVVFEDGTKVKVKKHKSDKGSVYTAVAYAITKKTYGSNKVFTEIVDEKLYKGGK